MYRVKCVIVIVKYFLILQCLADQSSQDNYKFLNSFTTYLNNWPDAHYKYEDATLINVQETEQNLHKIEVQLKATDVQNTDEVHSLQCTANLSGPSESPEVVSHNCQELATPVPTQDSRNEEVKEEVVKEHVFEQKATNIDNDIVHDADNVQPSGTVTVEDEAVARPIVQPGTPCVGCSTHVNPQASGVDQLADLGVRHLDIHDHNVKHTLDSVVDVERQVQVVNGVRYILTLLVDFNTCSSSEIEPCAITKTCKVTVLEKPWKKLPDGSKYRSILSNNCTEEWLFGDEGEVVIQNPSANTENNEVTHNSDFSNVIPGEEYFTERNTGLQSEPQQEKTLCGGDIKSLEEQIIPNGENKNLYDVSGVNGIINEQQTTFNTIDPQSKDDNFEETISNKQIAGSLSEDKKKAVDDLLVFFNYAPFNQYTSAKTESERIKRSEDYQVPLDDLRNIGTFSQLDFVGGAQLQDPNDEKYKDLAKESLSKYLTTSGEQRHHVIVKVENVTTQVVSGIKTVINFIISPTNCPINANDQSALSTCKIVDNDIRKCQSVVIEQPWSKLKEINVNCDSSYALRPKRQLPGGVSEDNVQNPKYLTLLEESLNKYHIDSHIEQYHKAVELTKVTTQVVAGSLTTLFFKIAPTNCAVNERGQPTSSICEVVENSQNLSCQSKIWEKPWMNFKEINVSCSADGKSRKKQALVGGEKEQNPNNPEYNALAQESLHKYLQTSGTTSYHQLVEIVKVTTQVVAGSLTRINFTIASTNCTNDKSDFSDCQILQNADIKNCFSKIWEKPWMDFKEINVTCDTIQTTRQKRDLGSTLKEQNPKDARFLLLAKESIEKYLNTSGIKQYHKVLEISRVTTQVVAGTKTIIDFKVAPTNCESSVNLTAALSKCKVDRNANIQMCRSKVWEKPWMNHKEINVSCSGDSSLLHNLIQESLQKLESLSINRYRQRVLKVNDYSTKITSGKLTTINFDVGYTSCLKFESVRNLKDCEFLSNMTARHCVANIWERLWLENGRKIDVNCQDDETIIVGNTNLENTTAAKHLANEALKYIEAKYPHPKKQKVVKIFSLQKQIVAGVHYRMKIEVGYTNCTALSIKRNCALLHDAGSNKFCRVNIWLRPWKAHPPNFHVSCDYPQNSTADIYHHLQAEQLFNEFISTYKPDYRNDMEQMGHRFQIFKENVKKIHELNIHEKGTAKYGITKFSDLSYDEFKAKYTGLKQKKQDHNQIPTRKATIPSLDLPQSYDWRDHGAVTKVKDQGSCGSCWAFSVTGNIEGQWKIKTGKLVSLSEQELVDCDKLDDGCQGGLPDNAYRAIESMGGLMSESDYPYDGENQKCVFNKTLARVQISGALNISTNETNMAKWLVGNGPISIGINANAMQFYMGGVSHPWKILCNPDNLDHGVLIVGYGEKSYPLFNKRLPYWIVKNSWGKGWGEQGYYRVFRGDGTCGVNMMASSATV